MISILMATYNGKEFIGEQIESILKQTNHDWHLYISDDQSNDGTWEVLLQYANDYPELIEVRKNAVNSGGASANFFGMLAFSYGYDYCMFCDQDDIWLPTKVESTFRAMKQMEKSYGRELPLVVHSDLIVADREGNTLEESMFTHQKLSGSGISFAKQLVQNSVTGCTMMLNKPVLQMLKSHPEYCIMHDWWIALIAAAFGKIGFLKTPLIRYRQHGNNAEGAKNYRSIVNTVKMADNVELIRDSFAKTYRQAEEFWRIFGEKLSSENKEIIEAYLSLSSLDKVSRLRVINKYGFWKSGWNRKAGQIVYM